VVYLADPEKEEHKVNRQSLWSVLALGALITALSGAGVVAVFSDTATTGTNEVSSGDRPHFEALQIALADFAPGGFACDVFSSDLHTGLFTVANIQPGDLHTAEQVCLRNDHSSPLNLSLGALDLVDTDPYCTNDEASVDTSCGTGGGELSRVLAVNYFRYDGCQSEMTTTDGQLLSVLASDPMPLGVVDAGSSVCFEIQLQYNGGALAANQQAAQTDEVTWRFAFTGTE
jgi:hypothetical protein